MEYKQLATEMHATRDFSDRPLAKADIEDIVAMAQHAPSWADSQPWKVYVAQGDTLKKIKQEHAKHVDAGIHGRAEMATLLGTRWDDYSEESIGDWGESVEAYLKEKHMNYDDTFLASERNLFNAPALLYVTIPKETNAWSIYDAGSFSQGLMMAAASKGIDTMPAYEIVKYPGTLHTILGIPQAEMLVIGIALGYRSEKPINDFKAGRRPTKGILEFKD